MINQLKRQLPKHCTNTISQSKFFIIDFKDINKGEIEIKTELPVSINGVEINNEKNIELYFDGFKDNALEISTGLYSEQCECVLFPATCTTTDWILFIEMKYANNLKAAIKKENNYPNKMINQIKATVEFFRSKNIIASNKKVHAIASFPNLLSNFNSFFDRNIINQLLTESRILLRPTNQAQIISEKRIKI